ncbi:MAG: hypothetical protein ABMB14_11995 [Myxococcota bacterium]
MIDIDELLGSFDDRDYSVRLVHTVCRVVPFAPDLTDWFSLVEGLKQLDPDAKKPVLDRARELSRSDEAQRALWMVKALDTADSGIGVFSGIASAVKLYQAKTGAERLDALETDTQQSIDAVLKGLAMSFVIYKLFPGGVTEKLSAFRNTQTGQAFVFYYAAIEVGLPFADNALLGGGALVKSLFDRFGPDQQAKLAAVAGPDEAQQAMGMMQQLMGPIETMAGMAKDHLGPIAAATSGFLATALNVGDKVAGVAATGADMLQVYRFLGARLVAEQILRQALAESKTVQAAKQAASPAAVEVKYTRSANDLPDAPKKRGGCFGLFGGVLLAAIVLGATAAAWASP